MTIATELLTLNFLKEKGFQLSRNRQEGGILPFPDREPHPSTK